MSLDFLVEWQEAPDVKDAVERATWGRLVIRAGAPEALTSCVHIASRQTREGVYGSVFPLVRWVVDSFWSLLNEPPRVPRARSGRVLARFPDQRRWVQRHNLLSAREGYALPDLTLARDGSSVVLWSFADPPDGLGGRPVRFLRDGVVRLPVRHVEQALILLIESTLERLRGVDHPSAQTLRQDWSAVLESMADERNLCEWASRGGLDPYDPGELTDDVERLLLGPVNDMPPDLREDLLDAAGSVSGLERGHAWLVGVLDRVQGGRFDKPAPQTGPGALCPAHEVGYWAARHVCREQGLKATELPSVGGLSQAYGLRLDSEAAGLSPGFVDGLIGVGRNESPCILGTDLPYADKAFRWGRALYLWRFGHLDSGPRLMTRAHSRLQRESRAFAAELLAPAAAIKQALRSELVGDEEIAELATEFRVNHRVIRHQVENHGLALLD